MNYVVMFNSENNMKVRIPKDSSAVRVSAGDKEEAIEFACVVLIQKITEQFDYMSCTVSNNTGEYVIDITNDLEPDFKGSIKDFVVLESME